MKKTTKNILLREDIENKLLELNKRQLDDGITLVCLTPLLFVFSMWLAFSDVISGFLIIKLLAVLIVCCLIFLSFSTLFRVIKERKQIKSGDFLISEKSVISKKQCLPNRHRQYDDLLVFEGFRDFFVSGF